ncbi:hypothetical protein [Sulfurospirillum halorespirans]|uniref:Lipoprotein n=1 Tax=Sulfurospirillum halorespirans DSM 13726 TaxID=1193502 RepID=A0A1D7TKS7_9BACT|nr:hypothetical protein [Sulfurospirillum halorespirans]AOO65598.1 hypothetical protein SHALO_1827 [Sulfurospirillum halorespirans DSM 13726]
MKKSFKSFILIAIAMVILTGCGSTYNPYVVSPTPIKKEQSKYYLQDISLVLDDSMGKLETRTIYLNQETLRKSFEEFINSELKEQGAYAEGDLKISIEMYYARIFNTGGRKLNKPEFHYSIKVFDQNNTLLAHYNIPRSTTQYNAIRNFAVNMQIGTFQRDEKDEPEDIALISKTLVKELRELGQ